MLSKTFEPVSDVGGVGCGVGIVDDDIVKVSGDAFEAFDDLVDSLDEPAGGGTATSRHDELLEKPVMCGEDSEGNGILVDGYLVEERGGIGRNMCPLPRESRISSTRRVGSCPRELTAFSFLLLIMRTIPSFLGIATIGLGYGEVECWMRPVVRYRSMTTSTYSARIGFIR